MNGLFYHCYMVAGQQRVKGSNMYFTMAGSGNVTVMAGEEKVNKGSGLNGRALIESSVNGDSS